MPPRRALTATLALLFATHRGARAHALVVESEPAAGARLTAPPARLRVRFNSRIDGGRSRLSLHGADGAAFSVIPEPPSDPTVLAAPCPPLAAGAWRLRWQVLAVDGHITRGDIAFQVA